MKFKEALAQIVNTDNAECVADAFYLYSRLSDLCTSYEDREKINIFFKLDKRLKIFKCIQTEGKVAIPILKAGYPAVKDILSHESYNKLIDCVAAIFFQPPAIKVRGELKKPVQKPVIQKAVVQRAIEEEEPETKTPLTATYVPTQTSVWKTILIIAAIVLAVAAGVTCLIVFRKNITWTGWQYVIGTLGGLVLLGLSGLVAIIIENCSFVDFYKSNTFIALAIAIANLALFCVFRGEYKIIFIFIAAYVIIGLAFTCYFAFDELEEGWGVAQIIEEVIIIAGLVLGLTISGYWTLWQFFIGGLGGLALLGIGIGLAMLASDMFDIEIYQFVPFLVFAVAVANFVLYCIFRVDYRIIFIFVSAYSLIGSGISTYIAFDDYEAGWGIVQIAEAVIIVAGLVLGLIFL